MATYSNVPREVPSNDRTTIITDVAVGDQIDIREILNRSARGMQFIMTGTTDVVQYRLNNLVRTVKVNESNTVTDYNWSTSFPTFSDTGAMVLQTVDNLRISSVDIVGLTLSVGATISIIVW